MDSYNESSTEEVKMSLTKDGLAVKIVMETKTVKYSKDEKLLQQVKKALGK